MLFAGAAKFIRPWRVRMKRWPKLAGLPRRRLPD